jgi:AGCS family alanine or glycine:cation symporter
MGRHSVFWATLLTIFCGLAAPVSAQAIDEQINTAIAPVTDFITSTVFYSVNIGGTNLPLVVVWLIIGAVTMTIWMRFINIRGFRQALRIVRGDYFDPAHEGEVTHFQALTAALSGTVGLGNIAGVAVAISLGGPGATFWMVCAGLLGMSSKFVECTLGVKYRRINADGTVSGGAMYYLSRGLAERGLPRLGKFLAVFFAIMCIGGTFGAGNMFQANQSFQQFAAVTGFNYGWVYGLVVAGLVALVIIGGIKSIARVTDKLVPLMCLIYITAAVAIIAAHLHEIPHAFSLIISGAFSPTAVGGGFIGVLITGFQRAAFSNEAGIGSAPIAHSAVATSEPVTEGFVSLLEPFIDTVIICTMTALVIVITDQYEVQGVEGVTLTSDAFASVITWFPYVLSVAVILFAFSTMITWSYYGLQVSKYLFGDSRTTDLVYKSIFCAFTVIGSSMQLDNVVGVSDAMIFLMALPNVLGLYLLAPVVKADLDSYLARLRSGEIRKLDGIRESA